MSARATSDDLRPGYVLPVRYGVPGGPTRKQARGPGWRRTSHGFYVPVTVPADDVRQRIVEASVVVPPGGAITGWAALSWLGGRWFGGLDARQERRAVPVVTGTRDIRAQPGIAPSGEGLDPRRVCRVDGLSITDAAFAVSYEMRHAPDDRAALVALDMAAYSDLASLADVADLLVSQSGWCGVPRARRVLPAGEENAWSPTEVDLRQVWVGAARRPRPLCNQPVFDRRTGAHIATPDVFDPVAGVAGEYDGELHLVRRQRDHDLRREGALRAHGIEIATMTAPDRHDPRAFVTRIDTAYAHAARHPVSDRTWTTLAPSWWTPTHTVDLRRALSPAQRRRLLAHRWG